MEWQLTSWLAPGNYRLVLEAANENARFTSVRLSTKNLKDNWEVTYLQFHRNSSKTYADFIVIDQVSTLRLSPKTVTLDSGIIQATVYRKSIFTVLYSFFEKTYSIINKRESFPKVLKSGVYFVWNNGLTALISRILYPKTIGAYNYSRWIETNEKRPKAASELYTDEAPLVSVILPLQMPVKTALLRETLESLTAQIYRRWELCIAYTEASQVSIEELIQANLHNDAIIKTAVATENSLSHIRNTALSVATGDWIVVVDPMDILNDLAFLELVSKIEEHPQAEIVYSDEDEVDESSHRFSPRFKSDFSLAQFQSHNFLGRLTFHRAKNIQAVGGWRSKFDGDQDYDLALRILELVGADAIFHIPKVLYHSRQASLQSSKGARALVDKREITRDVLEEHVSRTNLPARVEYAQETPYCRLRFEVPQPEPLVSLIILTRDKVELLRGCLESIISKTTYKNYEIIIVDNGSVEREAIEYIEEIKNTENITIIPYPFPFNYSAMNNIAVAAAKGDIVGLINNDIQVISPYWLTEMVSWAIQPQVGCVGAKLYYENDTIQHAGIALGIGGVAGHPHKHFPGQHPGYDYRLKIHQNYSAVTGACLVVLKSRYDEVGGLDEENLPIAFNDVDFCLKLSRAGYSHVWTPFAELYHLESISRGAEDSLEKRRRYAREASYMASTWNLKDDPFYSPNLSRDSEDFSLG
ncbi:glycosyltransferase family 2 protein [Phyllobacterium sp. SB3]|uniref:glycosyltransferase family 2 protein n=1 Tax=Phyllobacterium sp. SB3 TaxID=3156073 RepID=UPI0032AEF7AF